ncbi:MAG: hypothetical protein ONA90_08050, partial [candidate division KSB1 bacterium]|nr:hypothetical protein [candidate division KSB1 bacterium]
MITQQDFWTRYRPRDPNVKGRREQGDRRRWLLYTLAIMLYLIVRLFAWKRTTLLEDHDSISYLESIKVFLSFDIQRIF